MPSPHPLTQFIRNCSRIETLREANARIAEKNGYSAEKLELLWVQWKESGQKVAFPVFCDRERKGEKASAEEVRDLARQSPEHWRQILEGEGGRRFLRALGCDGVKEGVFQLRKLSNLAKVVSLGD